MESKNSTKYDVICYGTVCLDLMWRVHRLPEAGNYERILDARKMIGGEAANTAMALARWGVRVLLIGAAMGDDDDGRLLREMLSRDAADIDTSRIETLPGFATPFCACIATPDGHRTMFGRGFSDMQCPILTEETARSARIFTMDPNAYNPGWEACRIASDAGLEIVAMDYTRASDVNRLATVSVTSHEHVGAARPLQDYADYAVRLRDTYGTTAVVTCGQAGSFTAESGRNTEPALHVPAYVAPAVIDSTGAGDVFRAGLIYGRLQRWDALKTARFASAAAALNCTALGGWSGVRSLEEITTFQEIASLHEPMKTDETA